MKEINPIKELIRLFNNIDYQRIANQAGIIFNHIRKQVTVKK